MHPAHEVTREAWLALELWREFRAGGMGAGPLPEPGGALNQAACTMASFAALDAAQGAIRAWEKDNRPGEGDPLALRRRR